MFLSKRSFVIACGMSAALLAAQGCWNPFGPGGGEDPSPVQYHEYCDSAWKVIDNLEYAYISRDLNLYMSCFRNDFEFHLLETDWADYDGDGQMDTYWGLDREELFHTYMFNSVDRIELTLNGTLDYKWSGGGEDTLYRELPRQFDLKVHIGSGGYQATGTARFICHPDSTGEYYIYRWIDESDQH